MAFKQNNFSAASPFLKDRKSYLFLALFSLFSSKNYLIIYIFSKTIQNLIFKNRKYTSLLNVNLKESEKGEDNWKLTIDNEGRVSLTIRVVPDIGC